MAKPVVLNPVEQSRVVQDIQRCGSCCIDRVNQEHLVCLGLLVGPTPLETLEALLTLGVLAPVHLAVLQATTMLNSLLQLHLCYFILLVTSFSQGSIHAVFPV